MVRLIATCTAFTALLFAAACDGGASAVPVPQQTAAAPADEAPAPASQEAFEDRAPVPKIDGKPMWSANRRFTAQQNAQRHFERDGADFGAKSVEDYVAKAHAFVSNPPRGAATFKRPNGDTLIYDPAGNIFAVATRDGAPRTMFKPDEGAAYWEKVKAREGEASARRRPSDRG